MNLINDRWIPVIRQNNQQELIAPWQIAETANSVIEINAPRPDFQGALYQFLIGLLQTCFASEDEDDWLEFWETPPTANELRCCFEKVAFAFELNNPCGVAFMQDYHLPEGEIKQISALLIDAPGGKTVKDNLDHFIKRHQGYHMCSGCAAVALFTLQTNAPSGGVGHRVGLRGGGPLTTLVIQNNKTNSLWQQLWLNVLNQEELEAVDDINAETFPWLGPTRVSDKKGVMTTPADVHPLQMYWGMPRRIRLENKIEKGGCDLCGQYSETLFKQFRTQNYGINYDGAWVHPLTPYRFNPKKKNLPLSLKGQPGGLGYRHWLGLTLQNLENGDHAAKVVEFYNTERGRMLGQSTAMIWCFGYDMDNMKARCWFDSRFPLFYLDKGQKTNLMEWVAELVNAAREVIGILRKQLKSAWFRRPEDIKGDMSYIDAQFWQSTEANFYLLLEQLVRLPSDTRMAPPGIYRSWFEALQKKVFQLFETATLDANPEDLDLKRIIFARNALRKKFYGNKTIKQLKAKATVEDTA